MKNLLPALFICFLYFPLWAQSDRAVVELFPAEENGRWQSPVYEIPLAEATPFLSYFLQWEGPEAALSIRFSEDGQSWSEWHLMPRDEHSPELPLSILGSTGAEMRFFQIGNGSTESRIRRIACHFYNPRATERAPVPYTGGSGRSCSDLTPEYIRRSDWCPAGNCAEHPNPAYATATHLVVHHSAGTNQSSDWPAVVRSIWDYHVNGRGWSDIGYNWLIDPAGNIYTGRSNDAIGAHFCGTNTGTIGICMLGDFTKQSPQPEALSSLKKLLAWKACENDIDPLTNVYHSSSQKTLPTVIGHRDGCATACPGDLFYPQLPDIRTTLTEDQTTAVNDRNTLLDFRVYPNPSPGDFQILLPESGPFELEAVLYDLLGQRVNATVSSTADRQWDFHTDVPNGTYFLSLQSEGRLVGVKKVNIFR
ncbi:N-acetylmuramoyl-L-alanine amidase [Flavilitoribacter nigricans]|uniref:T9SS type A sorting domain-containing protein n=1 Tax=Flavilitoribacter nigricans (strain ATCC 23147 / DSM 23189 / NBRC 102662 / NCIMB 1420 / SS-2) TaxID=1122177 RepID=A0A2D0NFY4_FLAN2|nr:N-acetylmuramoyl-L-alanine amidase [Flavilitoribacter nigricans]PHN07414.1 hypothetical protein CRP01_07230 [Flavilitoribacter nigricans DSM 23189 = NBRC 102662]